MKAIKVTNKQKEELLVMCKALFPEYRHNKEIHEGGIVFHHNHGGKKSPYYLAENHLHGFKSDGSNGDVYDNADFCIHWFEFCIIFLLDKFNFEPNILLNSDLKNKHLIDYLYSEFKKLKS